MNAARKAARMLDMFGNAKPRWSPEGKFGRLLEAARIGSRDALGQLLEVFRKPLLKMARKSIPVNLQAKEEPSDLVQESFLEAQQDFDQFHGATEAELEAWLRGILQHKSAHFHRDYRESQKRATELEIPLDDTSSAFARHLRDALLAPDCIPEEAIEREERIMQLHAALNKLAQDQQKALVLRFFNGLSLEAIGKSLNCSTDAARMKLVRTIKELATLLGVRSEDVTRPAS